MNLQEFYSAIGGSYEDILRRLGQEARVIKFLSKFAQDQSFAQLCTAMEAEDYETAFRAAHSLKGICMNLGLAQLQQSSSDLTEALRGGATVAAPALLQTLKQDYAKTLAALGQLRTS